MPAPPASPATFWRTAPGQRFQSRYWRHRGQGRERPMLARIMSLALGTSLAALGVLLLVLPGPGIVFLAMGGAFYASESLRIARALDWCEVRGRALVSTLRRRWQQRRR